MSQVYMNFYMTITASCAENGAAGFLKLRYHDSNSVEAGLVFLLNKPLKTFRGSVIRAPLNKRGWTLQERILSPRILYFAEDQIHWKCQEFCESESGMDALNEMGTDAETLKGYTNLGLLSPGPGSSLAPSAEGPQRYAGDGSMSLYWDWYDILKD
jgi:hypothetical protein